MNESAEVTDKRVLDVAAEVAEANGRKIPQLLLSLQEVLDSYPGGSLALQQVKLDIWTYDLLAVLLQALRQDLNLVDNAWDTTAKLAGLLCNCCIGLDPAGAHHYKEKFLPDVTECLLTLSRKLQAKYTKTSNVLQDQKKNLLKNFQSVINSMSLLFSAHDLLITFVLQSPWLLQMLITDEVETAVVVMGCVQSAHRMKHSILDTLPEKTKLGLLDELVYKLTASSSARIASSSTRTMLVICDSQPNIVQVLCVRYRGLRPLLSKWQQQGFNRDLNHLLLLLETGSMQQARQEQLNQAASKIQAAWRSYFTRTRLGRANRAFKKFHRSFRAMKEVKKRQEEEEKGQKELEHMLLMQRKRAMRELHQRHLAALQILPASDVNRHLEEQQQDSATLIQSAWRGYCTRKSMHMHRQTVSRSKAAVTMQRATRQWLTRRKVGKEPPAWQRPPGLTDARRVELQSEINKWQEDHPVPSLSSGEQKDLHDKVQVLLGQYMANSRSRRKQELHREALMATLEMDSALLLGTPKLEDITEEELKLYSSTLLPVATKARYNHSQELRLLRQPWWQKLGDEYQDEKEMADWNLLGTS